MAAALSLDLRRRVVAAIEAGASCRQAAARFGVGIATAIRWQAQWRHQGHVAAKPMGGDRSSHRIEAHAALILTMLDARPQLFLRELRDQLREHGVQTSTSGLWRFLSRHPWSFVASPGKRGDPRGRAGPSRREGGPPRLVRRPARP